MEDRFRFEYDMIPPITTIGQSLFENEAPLCTFLECVGSPGVADVVFIVFDLNAIQTRLAYGLDPITRTVDMNVLLSLDLEIPKEIDSLKKQSGFSKYYIKSSLNTLVERGFVEKNEDGFLRSPKFIPVVKKIVAIEAKRENWVQGVAQARRYLRFANKVFLALDKAFEKRVYRHKESLYQQDIGLMTVDAKDNSVDIVISPEWQNPMSNLENYLIGERLWSMIYTEKSTANFGLYLNSTAPMELFQ